MKALFLGKQGAAPKQILELTVCGCRASKCNARSCKCVKNSLNCTSTYTCERSEKLCENELTNKQLSDFENSDSNDTSEEEEDE